MIVPEHVPGPDLADAFHRHHRLLAGAAARALGGLDDVDDVLQDAFVEAMRGVHNLRAPAALRAWLVRVTVRTARRRSARARFVGLDEAPAAADVADPRPSPLDLAVLAAIGEVVAAIPPERCRPWALRTFDGEPIDDIAASCGCSPRTVKRRIAEVQGLLAAALE
jgi:RNA polymerase sigma-70 factor (ECF subfamily)